MSPPSSVQPLLESSMRTAQRTSEPTTTLDSDGIARAGASASEPKWESASPSRGHWRETEISDVNTHAGADVSLSLACALVGEDLNDHSQSQSQSHEDVNDCKNAGAAVEAQTKRYGHAIPSTPTPTPCSKDTLSAPPSTTVSALLSGFAPISGFCWSPGFYAPEVLLKDDFDGLRADLFGIGAISLELLCPHMTCDKCCLWQDKG